MNFKNVFIFVLLLMLAGCAASGGFPVETAKWANKIPADQKIEITLAPVDFGVSEVEFYIIKEEIPVNITKIAMEVMPGGKILETEVEYHGPDKFYVITCNVNGQAQEVMFKPDGTIYRWELEIAEANVPAKMLERAMTKLPKAKLVKSEKILDGNQDTMEYHFKMVKGGIKYKIVVAAHAGAEYPVIVYRETKAEIEVPVK